VVLKGSTRSAVPSTTRVGTSIMGGNLLINVGSDGTGRIPDLQHQPLRELSAWLDVFRTVCKVGTGFSDAELAALPERLAPLAQEQRPARVDAHIIPDVWFEPSPAVEVLGAELTVSPTHTAAWGQVKEDAGPALPFPRFTGRYRDAKSPEDATTVQEVRSCTAPPARPRPAPDRYGLGAAG